MRNGRLHFLSEFYCGLTTVARAHRVAANLELLKLRQRAEVLQVFLVTDIVIGEV